MTARAAAPHRYIAFHKPYGVLSQFTDDLGRPTLAAFGLPTGVYPAGRLDRDSEGLLLLTDDGPFIKRLLDPRRGHGRRYLAQVEGVPGSTALAALSGGVTLGDWRTRPCQVALLPSAPDLVPRDPPIRVRRTIPTAWLEITLFEGKNRQVRRMTAAVGHPTLRLVRVAIAALTLGDLSPGVWRAVAPSTILPAAVPRQPPGGYRSVRTVHSSGKNRR
ncbi:MAG: pseudouridine synthase [Inquilinaceae bacterium]